MSDLNAFPDRFREAKAAVKVALANRDDADKAYRDAQGTVAAAYERLTKLRGELIEAAHADDDDPGLWWQCKKP